MVLGKGLVRRHGGVPEPDHSPSPHPGGPGSLRSQQSSGSDCPSSRAAWQLQSAPAAFSKANSHTCSPKGPATPRPPAPPGPSGLPDGARLPPPPGLGCSCTLLYTLPLPFLVTAAPAGAAVSCRRSRHLRRRGRAKLILSKLLGAGTTSTWPIWSWLE